MSSTNVFLFWSPCHALLYIKKCKTFPLSLSSINSAYSNRISIDISQHFSVVAIDILSDSLQLYLSIDNNKLHNTLIRPVLLTEESESHDKCHTCLLNELFFKSEGFFSAVVLFIGVYESAKPNGVLDLVLAIEITIYGE